VRDRALLLVGFAGAFRRAELVALNLDDVTEEPKGFTIKVRRSKKDQEGHGMVKVIDYGEHIETCPARSLKALLSLLEESERPLTDEHDPALFRSVRHRAAQHQVRFGQRLSPEDVSRILKRAAARVGMSLEELSAHSLRAGFVTTSARAGVPMLEIVEQTGQTIATAQGYVRGMDLMNKGVAKKIGL
jgi:integrase